MIRVCTCMYSQECPEILSLIKSASCSVLLWWSNCVYVYATSETDYFDSLLQLKFWGKFWKLNSSSQHPFRYTHYFCVYWYCGLLSFEWDGINLKLNWLNMFWCISFYLCAIQCPILCQLEYEVHRLIEFSRVIMCVSFCCHLSMCTRCPTLLYVMNIRKRPAPWQECNAFQVQRISMHSYG